MNINIYISRYVSFLACGYVYVGLYVCVSDYACVSVCVCSIEFIYMYVCVCVCLGVFCLCGGMYV